jgi:DNA/RNA endonuclease G (NUC1)
MHTYTPLLLQVGLGFNRDYWARFEKFVRDLSWSCEDVWVITGPLYLPQRSGAGGWAMSHPMIGVACLIVYGGRGGGQHRK